MKYRLSAGEHVDDAARGMISMAQLHCTRVYVDFNGVRLYANAESNPAEIAEFYYREFSKAEERRYFEARGALAEGRKGRISRPKPGQKRSSFLVVRLTGEELTRLRDRAVKKGLGVSTFARMMIVRIIREV